MAEAPRSEEKDEKLKKPKKPLGSEDDPEEGSDTRSRTVIVGLLLLVGTLAVVQFLGSNASLSTLRYDEFKAKVRAGQVEELWIGPDRIAGRTRRPEATTPAPAQNNQTRRNTVPDFETVRVGEDRELLPLLEEKRVRYSGLPDRQAFWATVFMLISPIVVVLLIWRATMRRMQNQTGGVLAFGKSKGRIVGESEVTVRFEDVAGVEEAKEELKEIVDFLKTPERYTRLGARIPKGVLLVGPPGTGKTLLAKAVAGEAAVPFFSISGSEFVEMFVGVGAARVRDMFEQAGQQAPCIVFIDELDALGRSRGANIAGTNEEREQTLNQLLVEMDGFGANKGVIIMAATNRPEVLDPALLRPGRFDRQVLVDRPDKKGREAILKVHARKVLLEPSVDLGDIAARTAGLAGADLANVINEAALLAARKNQGVVKKQDITEAIDRVLAGLERRSRVIAPEERERIAFHEVGHAVVGEVLPGGEKTAKISIVPRGVSALGYTMPVPREERYVLTEASLRARLAAILGGRAAERLVYNDLSTGAANDLAQATELARSMVLDFGMSPKIGPVSHRSRNTRVGNFIPELGSELREHSEQTAEAIDNEVRRLVEEAESEAFRVLRERRPTVERIARLLIEQEYLDGDELRALLVEARTPSLPPPHPPV